MKHSEYCENQIAPPKTEDTKYPVRFRKEGNLYKIEWVEDVEGTYTLEQVLFYMIRNEVSVHIETGNPLLYIVGLKRAASEVADFFLKFSENQKK